MLLTKGSFPTTPAIMRHRPPRRKVAIIASVSGDSTTGADCWLTVISSTFFNNKKL